jgi:hypothetical protein
LPADRTDVPVALLQQIRRAARTRGSRARVILDHSLEELPHYRGLPEEMVEEIARSVRRHLAMFYRVTLDAGRPLTDEDLEPSRETARQRAGQGVPLGEFLMFFHVGLRVAWEDMIRRVGADPVLRAGLLDRVAAVIRNQQLLMTALTEAYVRESERLSRFRDRDVDDFFRLLLSGDAVPHVVETRLAALGIDPSQACTVAVFGSALGEGPAPGVEPGDVQRHRLALDPGSEIRVGRCREGFAALLGDAPDPKQLAAATESLFGREVRVGLGTVQAGDALRGSARQALRALRLGLLLQPRDRVHVYADLAVADLVDVGSAGARDFMRDVLGPLARAGAGRTHLSTLRELARHGYRLKVTAAALDVHPHTLSYRIKQLRRRFGLDLDDPELRMRVQLALLILDAQGPDPDA